MIKTLTINDWRDMKQIIEATQWFEGLGMTDEMKKKIISRIYSRLIWQKVHTFGYFHDENLLAFFQFLEWPEDIQNYSIWNSFAKKNEEIQLILPNETRRTILVQLLNHGIEFMESLGRKIAWINCPPRKPTSLRWNILNESILGKRNLIVVEEVIPGNKPTNNYWIWHPHHKQTRQLIKIYET